MLDARGRRRMGATGEKRTRPRTRVGLKGKLFIPGREVEDVCEVVDLSPSGAGLRCTASASQGTKIVLYVEGFGRYEGEVAWRDRTLLGLKFHCSDAKRANTAGQLSAFVANGMKTDVPLRSMPRVKRVPELHQILTLDGAKLDCEVVDIALGGASLKTVARPEIGRMVYFGETGGRVIRHTDIGIVVEFLSGGHRTAHHAAAHQ